MENPLPDCSVWGKTTLDRHRNDAGAVVNVVHLAVATLGRDLLKRFFCDRY